MEPSNWAACFEGPKQFKSRDLNLSVIPSTRGISGPIIVKSMELFRAKLLRPSISSTAISMFETPSSLDVPPFPGAT